MKKLLTIAAACLLSFTMTACSSNNEGGQSAAPQNKLEEIQQKGKLVMAVSPDFPPFEFIDNTKSGIDQYVGADIELGKYIAEQLGVVIYRRAAHQEIIALRHFVDQALCL